MGSRQPARRAGGSLCAVRRRLRGSAPKSPAKETEIERRRCRRHQTRPRRNGRPDCDPPERGRRAGAGVVGSRQFRLWDHIRGRGPDLAHCPAPDADCPTGAVDGKGRRLTPGCRVANFIRVCILVSTLRPALALWLNSANVCTESDGGPRRATEGVMPHTMKRSKPSFRRGA
jgi:hypothetical protein